MTLIPLNRLYFSRLSGATAVTFFGYAFDTSVAAASARFDITLPAHAVEVCRREFRRTPVVRPRFRETKPTSGRYRRKRRKPSLHIGGDKAAPDMWTTLHDLGLVRDHAAALAYRARRPSSRSSTFRVRFRAMRHPCLWNRGERQLSFRS
jgi:hypothetical protein